MVTNINKMLEAMKPQSNEFDALNDLIKSYNNLPAIVDDDYSRMRHYYESNLKVFLEACKNNGRI